MRMYESDATRHGVLHGGRYESIRIPSRTSTPTVASRPHRSYDFISHSSYADRDVRARRRSVPIRRGRGTTCIARAMWSCAVKSDPASSALMPLPHSAGTRSTRPIRAGPFDVDGTLYSQTRLRARVASMLVRMALSTPVATLEAIRVLRTFRRMREELRGHDGPELLETLQYFVVAERLGIHAQYVRTIVEDWMMRRPLPLVASAIQPDLRRALQVLCARGIRIGALSDYPVVDKLRALDVDAYFDVRLCTTDPAINAFKPSPKGFLRACELWGLAPQEVLYVGDRPDIDAVGAASAGLRCAIIASGRQRERQGSAPIVLRRYADLADLVDTL